MHREMDAGSTIRAEKTERRGAQLSEQVRERLSGSRIRVIGDGGSLRQELLLYLRGLAADMKNGPEIIEDSPEIRAGEYVILFGTGTGQCSAAPFGTETGQCSSALSGTVPGWRKFLDFTEFIKEMSRKKPGAALFVSDSRVYGKVYGTEHLLAETETGYLCHTAEKDLEAQQLRTMEHLWCRMAREEGIPAKIARVPQAGEASEAEDRSREPENGPEQTNRSKTAEGFGQMSLGAPELLLRVLLCGASGEVYNVSGEACSVSQITEKTSGKRSGGCGGKKKWQTDGERSPLAPIPVRMDTGKAEGLG